MGAWLAVAAVAVLALLLAISTMPVPQAYVASMSDVLDGRTVPASPRTLAVEPQEVHQGIQTTGEPVNIYDVGYKGPAPMGTPLPEPNDPPFGTEVAVTTDPGTQEHPSIVGASDGSWLVVAYTNMTANQDIYVARSTDGGATWTHAPAAATGSNEWDPVAVRHGTRIYIFFSHDNAAFPNQFRWVSSMDNGVTWSPGGFDFTASGPIRLFRNADAVSDGTYMWVSHDVTCTGAPCSSTPPFSWQVTMTHVFDLAGVMITPSIYFPFAQSGQGFDVIEPTIGTNGNWVAWYGDSDGTNLGCDAGDREILNMRTNRVVPQSGSSWIDAFIYGVCSTDALAMDASGQGTTILTSFVIIDPGIGFNDHAILTLYNPNDGDPLDWNFALLAGAPGMAFKHPNLFASTPLMHASFFVAGELGYTFSTDAGATWDPAMKVNSNTGTVVDASRGSAVTYAGGVRIVWQDDRLANDDIFYSDFAGWVFYIFDRAPRQGTLNIDGTDYAVPVAFLRMSGSSMDVIAPDPDTVGPGERLLFVDWSPDANTSSSRTLTVGGSDVTWVANYAREYFLNISTTVPGGTTTPTSGWFAASSPVDIFCNLPPDGADSRWRNPTWTGSGPGSYNGAANNPDTILMNGPITEVCDASGEWRHTYDTNPTGLNIRVDGGAPVAAPQTYWWAQGSSHTVECVTPQSPVSPQQRYVFTQWDDTLTTNPRTFSNVNSAVNRTCEYVLEYEWTFSSNPASCTYTVQGTTYAGPQTLWFPAGATRNVDSVSPQPVTANQRFVFASWSDGGAKAHSIGPISSSGSLSLTCTTQWRYQFDTVPTGYDVIIDGSAYPTPTVDFWWNDTTSHTARFDPVTVSPGVRRAFNQWADGNTLNPRTFVSGTATPGVRVVQTALEYNYVFTTNPAGFDVHVDGVACPTTPSCSVWWREMTTHTAEFRTITTADMRQTFSSWSDGNTTALRTFVNVNAANSLTANIVVQYRYQFGTNPAGLAFLVDGAAGVAGFDYWWDTGTAHSVEFQPIVTGDSRRSFSQWGDANTNNPRTFTAGTTTPGNYLINTALEWRYTFDTSPTGDPVFVDGVTCSTPCTTWWLDGSSHTVEYRTNNVSADERRVFNGWADANTNNPRTFSSVTTFGSHTVNTKTQYRLTVTTAQGTATGAGWYDSGATATAAVTNAIEPGANADERWRFSAWTGDATGTTQSVTVTMSGPRAVTAGWIKQFRLTVSTPYGTATQTNADGFYDTGATATVTVSGSPAAGTATDTQWRFDRWTGDAAGTLMSADVMMNAPKTATASWVQQVRIRVVTNPDIPEATATITVDGQGSTLPATGMWVDVGSSYSVSIGEEVTSGGKTFRFLSWDGANTGTASVPLTLTANFEEVSLFGSPILLIVLLAAIVGAALLLLLLLMRRKKKPAEAAGAGEAAEAEAAPEEGMIACPSCGSSIPAVAGPCPECGAEIALE